MMKKGMIYARTDQKFMRWMIYLEVKKFSQDMKWQQSRCASQAGPVDMVSCRVSCVSVLYSATTIFSNSIEHD